MSASVPYDLEIYKSYPLLEASQISRAECVSLGNDGDQVNTSAQSLHNFDIKGLQSMTGRSDEVKTGVDAEVDLVRTTGLLLLQHVGFMLIVKEFDDWHPGVAVVHVVAETGCIDNGQADCKSEG